MSVSNVSQGEHRWLEDWLQANTLASQVHPLLGTLILFNPKVGQKVGRISEQVGSWTLGRLGLHKALGSLAGPAGTLLLGGALGAIGRLFRRPGPTGRTEDAYESFQKSGQSNLHTGLMNFFAQQQAQYVKELLASAQNVGNRALGAAMMKAVAPEAMRAAIERYGLGLRTGAEVEQRTIDRIMQERYQNKQLGLQVKQMEEERKSAERTRQLQILAAVLPYIFNQSNKS